MERKIKILLITLTIILIVVILGVVYAINRKKAGESVPVPTQEPKSSWQPGEKVPDKDAFDALNLRAGENSGAVSVSDEEAKKSLSVPMPTGQAKMKVTDEQAKNALNAK